MTTVFRPGAMCNPNYGRKEGQALQGPSVQRTDGLQFKTMSSPKPPARRYITHSKFQESLLKCWPDHRIAPIHAVHRRYATLDVRCTATVILLRWRKPRVSSSLTVRTHS